MLDSTQHRAHKASFLTGVKDTSALDSAGIRTYWITASLLTVFATGFVYYRAWVAEDAFITFRYTANCLEGLGPVFNQGERVQAFSHPLWFLLLLAAASIINVYAASVVYGLAFTVGIVVLLARLFRNTKHNLFRLQAVVIILLSSKTFIEYQTSGLETSLSNILIVALWGWITIRISADLSPAVAGTAWLCSLLLLNRPDHLVLCGPILAGLVLHAISNHKHRKTIGLVSAIIPLLAWYGFSTVYYGTPLPNTAYAKTALPLWATMPRGIAYAWDYCRHEPVHALMIITTIVTGLVISIRDLIHRRSGAGMTMCLTLAIVAQICYVLSIGGDFMRGRLFSPILVSSAVLFVHLFSSLLASRDLSRLMTLALAVGGFSLIFLPTFTIKALTCIRAGHKWLQYGAFQWRFLAGGIALAFLIFILAGTHKLQRIGGRRCVYVFLALIFSSYTLLVGMIGYWQLSWGVIGIFAVTSAFCAYGSALFVAGQSIRGFIRCSLLGLLIAAAGSLCDIVPRRCLSNGDIDDAYSFFGNVPGYNRFREPLEAQGNIAAHFRHLGDVARGYSQQYGPITIAFDAIGISAYHAGSKVKVIDILGLADPFIARSSAPIASRAGHIDFEIPQGYLQTRGVINLLPNWFERLEMLDPTLIVDTQALKQNVYWPDQRARRRWLEVELIISGDLLSMRRLKGIPRYMFPERRFNPVSPAQQAPRFRLRPGGEKT